MHPSYLDSLIDWDPEQMVFWQDREPTPFHEFNAPGFFNGIKLS
jgi:hypothetical protein